MRTLIQFLITFRNLFAFILLEVICLIVLVKNNQFQRFQILTSSNYLIGNVFDMRQGVMQYFSLADVNRNLARQNAELQSKLSRAQRQLDALKSDTSFAHRKSVADEKHFSFITARVINSTTSSFKNVLTIDRGSKDGVRVDMGVICDRGLVGIVSNVSENFAIVVPTINTVSQISAKIKGKNASSTLYWNGGDVRYAELGEVPLYVPAEDGDIVVTSGYSSIFPEGIMVGTITEHSKGNDDFHNITVELSTDFLNLSFVDVIDFDKQTEKEELEKEAAKNEQ